ncbi:hypothetical protein Acr_08g0003610 [Actinidia rufa]|uniref:NB-ARC domain-containing disease resistance protein n=1 Tax=Actinidia rufa TaxID=165716 RepID=A0A7J0EZU6_9ERIC|nr:hypothetical protein Acr_08g0003610 [Actinidia rufa]
MTDTVVNFVIERLVMLLQEKANLLGGVSKEVNSIVAELQVIQPFLRDADERADRGELNEGGKAWVKHTSSGGMSSVEWIHWILRQSWGNAYGFSSIDQQGSTSSGKNITWHDPRVASLFIEKAEVVGIKTPRNKLVSWLVKGSPKRGVISVVGMGGIGKTTLAKKVYDHPRVTAHFNCHAWISVSETYKMEELLKIMIKKFYREKKKQKESAHEDMDKMDVMSLIKKLRDYLEGKRYVVVFDDVWDLEFWAFIKNALPDKADRGSRVVITTRSDAVADSCKESPFYHVHKLQPLPPEMAWDLFCKKAFQVDFEGKVTRQWQTFLDSLGSELGSNPRFTGLVQRKDGKTLEEVAEEYLTELIYRSLVQVSWVNFDGKARSCRVHDIMREIILLISKDLGFCDILSKDNPGFESLDGLEPRRLSIHDNEDKVLESITGSRIRSVFSFNAEELPESFVGILFVNFKLLKTLDFEDAPLHYLPQEVGNLFHLRLHKLRHLLVYYFLEKIESGIGVKIHEGFGRLESLQKLYFVEANHGPWLFEDLRKLTQLRKLGITKLKCEDGKALCTAIEKMNHLESLDVASLSRDEILDLQHIACAPQYLRRLYLYGRLEKFPVWISTLENLVRVRFYWSRLTEDPLPFLQDLPNLLVFGLYGAYEGELLHFREGGFQKLKELELRYLSALNSVIIDNGALPLLQELDIGGTPQLKEVPSGIQHLRKFTNLKFYDMTDEFALRMLPEEGQDYKVVFARRNESGQYYAYHLR